MNIELSEITVISLTLGLIVLVAIRNQRRLNLRVSPKSVELDLDHADNSEPAENAVIGRAETNPYEK